MVSFKPLHNYVRIKRDEPQSKGLILSLSEEKVFTGVVLAVGEECTDVKPGDRIRLETKTHTNETKSVTIDYCRTVVVGGEEIVIVKEDNILGIFE